MALSPILFSRFEYTFVSRAHAVASFWAVSGFVSLTVKSMASTFGSAAIVVSARSCDAGDPGQPAALDDTKFAARTVSSSGV